MYPLKSLINLDMKHKLFYLLYYEVSYIFPYIPERGMNAGIN